MKYDQVKNYYEDIYQTKSENAFPIDEERYKACLSTASEKAEADEKTLDIGCGAGFVSNILSQRGFTVYGSDISDAALDIATNNVPDGNFFRSSETGHLDYPNEYFDLITCLGVLEHILTPQMVVDETYRVLKKGGLTIFVVPNSKCPYFWLGGTEQIQETPRLLKEWSNIFTKTGYIIDSVRRDPEITYNRNFSLSKKIKILLHQILNKLSLGITYQFIFTLKKK